VDVYPGEKAIDASYRILGRFLGAIPPIRAAGINLSAERGGSAF
jgi:hypothetical protein